MIDPKELAAIIDQYVRNAVAPIESRLAALESRSKKIAYAGVWAEGAHYEAGEFCTHRGSLWACHEATDDKPGTSLRWQLAVKSAQR